MRFPDQLGNATGPLLLEVGSSRLGMGADSDSIAECNTRNRQAVRNSSMLVVEVDSKHLVPVGCNIAPADSTWLPTAVLERLCTTFQIIDMRPEQNE